MEVCLNNIAKVEGHANLIICIDDATGKVKDAHLDIFESPRFFENIVMGRSYRDLPIETSRICGMCSYSHTLGSLLAVESAFGITVTEQTEKLRDLLLYGTIIQSHTLHLGFLSLPDYMDAESIFDIAQKNQELVKEILELRNAGGKLLNCIGGRNIHTVSSRVGGFSAVPSKDELKMLKQELVSAKKYTISLFEMYSDFNIPKFERKTVYMALTPNFFRGKMRAIAKYDSANDVWDCTTPADYMSFVKEFVVPYSTAKYTLSEGSTYMVGALARININPKDLSDGAKKLLKESPVSFPCYSPYANNICQCIEIMHCIDSSIQLLDELSDNIRDEKPIEPHIHESEGVGIAEVPRGTLFHHYHFDSTGKVVQADIITPTSQNLFNIEADIRQLAPALMSEGKERLTMEMEKLIRAYDPCISCATHFLTVEIKKA